MTNTNKIIVAIVVLIILGWALYFLTRPTADVGDQAMTATSTDTITAVTPNAANTTTNTPNTTTNTITTVNTANTNTGPARKVEDVSLNIGQTGGTDSVSIFFRNVTDDSRCAKDVRCIQAGSITADLVFTAGGKQSQILLQSNGQTATFNGYSVKITEVAPEKFSDKDVNKDSYRIGLLLTPIN